ncbi:hypothetical protein BS50DRAFT_179073 [Corynespora cassiicola Philippines]|uniref:Uncharacterized protein n=1 Tax=Corynespora cassiicola Philippines TaxID=1448308 RepID=A0A2T2P5X7_CORCC|nr:hypothetical protein BS50DRAFT_179073 [Corynespora cassiicola Philippines]
MGPQDKRICLGATERAHKDDGQNRGKKGGRKRARQATSGDADGRRQYASQRLEMMQYGDAMRPWAPQASAAGLSRPTSWAKSGQAQQPSLGGLLASSPSPPPAPPSWSPETAARGPPWHSSIPAFQHLCRCLCPRRRPCCPSAGRVESSTRQRAGGWPVPHRTGPQTRGDEQRPSSLAPALRPRRPTLPSHHILHSASTRHMGPTAPCQMPRETLTSGGPKASPAHPADPKSPAHTSPAGRAQVFQSLQRRAL